MKAHPRTSLSYGAGDDEATILPWTNPDEAIDEGADLQQHALPIGTRLGEFEILGLIGEGGFGIVYLAQDHALQRRIALKEYLPRMLAARRGELGVSVLSAGHKETFATGLKSFVNEARLLAQFDHPSLVKVFRFWEANGTAYIVMPYYVGPTLRGALKAMDGPPNEAWLKNLLTGLLDALRVVHEANCLHRDIAPDNILLLSQGRPLLLDFGAARQVVGDEAHALTAILKPGYAPIEQYAEASSAKQGPWTDYYALAGVAYYALTGKAPLPAVARIMSEEWVSAEQAGSGRYSAEFLRGIDRALGIKPEDRPRSDAEMRRALGLTQAPRAAPEDDPDRTIQPGSEGAKRAGWFRALWAKRG